MTALISGLIAVFLWSAIPIISGLISADITPSAAAFYTVLFGAVGFSIPMTGQWHGFLRKASVLTKKEFVAIIFISLNLALFYYFLFSALNSNSPIESGAIIYFWPVLLIVFSYPLKKSSEGQPNLVDWLFILMAFFGVFLLAVGNNPGLAISGFKPEYFQALAAAISAAAFFIGISEVKRFFKKNIYIFFIASVIAAAFLLTATLSIESHLAIPKQEPLISLLVLGLIIYPISHLSWIYSVQNYDTVSTAALAFLTPVFTAVYTTIFFGESIIGIPVFGIALVLFSNIVLHSKNWYTSATTGSLLFMLSIGIIIFLTKGDMGKVNHFGSMELIGTTFAIVIGFTLARISNRNREEERYFNVIASYIHRILVYSLDVLSDIDQRKLKQQLDALLQDLINFDYGAAGIDRELLASDVYMQIEEIESTLVGDDNKYKLQNLKNAFLSIQQNIGEWMLMKTDRLSVGEHLSIWLLGCITIVSFVISRSDTFAGDLSAIGFSTSIMFLLLVIRDYNMNRPEHDFTKVLISQNIFKRNKLDYYLPHNIMSARHFPSPMKSYQFRYWDEYKKSINTKRVQPENSLVRAYNISIIVFFGICLILTLYFKHDGVLI